MLIDFHVHAFVDDIADRAVGKLCKVAKIPNYSDGTIKDTEQKLRGQDVDYGVLLPIATKPTQQKTINNWAAEVNGGPFISFGTIHPNAEDALGELERIKSLGLKGVKLHPDYQGVFLFEERYVPIWRKCAELDLPVTIHMGYDPISPLVHHAMPQDLAHIHSKVPEVKLIAAHMGGVHQWEAAYHYVCGDPNIWLDTAYTAGLLDEGLMLEMIRKHGAHRVLFASDLPWHPPEMEREVISRLTLTDAERRQIFWQNAVELLKLKL